MSSEDFAFVLLIGIGGLVLNALVCACARMDKSEPARWSKQPDECSECGICDFSEAEQE
jgi:hypothetical protein